MEQKPLVHGWRSRGYLPHCDERGLVQHIVFGLDDAMPRTAPAHITDPAARTDWADKTLDVGRGSRLLAVAHMAQIVQDCLLFGDGERYRLAAWCVMPTHVHALVEQTDRSSLAEVVQTWKSFTAHAINRVESRKGRLWRREYFDRYMRSAKQFEWTLGYVENNPVAAGLCARPEDWPFSSAHVRNDDQRPRFERAGVAGEDAGGP